MSQQGEAAEQIVNMATNVTVKGVECLTNLAGRGALSLATFLIAALKDEKRTSGKARMRAFNGKPTKVFAIKAKDLKLFSGKEQKRHCWRRLSSILSTKPRPKNRTSRWSWR